MADWRYITRDRVGRDCPCFGTRSLWTHKPLKTPRGTFDHPTRPRLRASCMRCTSKANATRRLGRDVRRGECVSLRTGRSVRHTAEETAE